MVLALALATLSARAEGQDEATCLRAAAERYRLPVPLVQAVRQVEGGAAGKVSRNRNGTYDIGPMQINSVHLPELSRYGISESALRDDACLNIHIGAWMLHREIATAPDVWTGIGRYHSRTQHLNVRYQVRVWKALQRLSTRLAAGGE